MMVLPHEVCKRAFGDVTTQPMLRPGVGKAKIESCRPLSALLSPRSAPVHPNTLLRQFPGPKRSMAAACDRGVEGRSRRPRMPQPRARKVAHQRCYGCDHDLAEGIVGTDDRLGGALQEGRHCDHASNRWVLGLNEPDRSSVDYGAGFAL